jgi:GMP synthase-like glutamine amidotransferase
MTRDGVPVRAADAAAAGARAGVPVRPADAAVAGARDGTPTRALVLQHGDSGPPALLAEWLDERGIAYDVHRTYVGEPMPGPGGYSFVASLGSDRNPDDTHDPAVADELVLLERAVEQDVPVLGLCFGGQALAVVLGGSVERAPEPELGWSTIETDEPELVAAGPWLQWHYDRFSTPPGATEIARTARAPQAFRHGRHLGVQFHPESTAEIVAQWAALDAERLRARGIDDGPGLIAATSERREAARTAAFALFDGFLERATSAAPIAARRG